MSNSNAFAPARGRDVPWPLWAHSAPAAPRHDSLVINSTGVCALTFAGRAARSSAFQEKVRVVGEPVQESQRLIGGVTLRARTVDYFAEALGVSRERVLGELFGPDWRAAETDRQIGALCAGSVEDGFRVLEKGCFMDRDKPRPNRSAAIPLAYGVRNSRLRASLQKLALECGAMLTDAPAPSLELLLAHADGDSPLVVNGTPKPLAQTPVERPPQRPRQFVGAAQVTFRSVAKKGVLEPHSSFVCWVLRDGALDMGVYYPFQDALTPTADYYGIFYRVVSSKAARKHGEAVTSHLSKTVLGIGEMIGLEPVDAEETIGTALVPVSPWRGVSNSQDGVLDLSRIAGAGAPIITGDGMTRSAIAGLVAAESLLAGREPGADVDRALGRYRQLNRELHLAITSLSHVCAGLMRLSPRLVLFRQSRSYVRDMWAGVY